MPTRAYGRSALGRPGFSPGRLKPREKAEAEEAPENKTCDLVRANINDRRPCRQHEFAWLCFRARAVTIAQLRTTRLASRFGLGDRRQLTGSRCFSTAAFGMFGDRVEGNPPPRVSR